MPATTDYLPTREADLLQWARTFDENLSTLATEVGISASQATTFKGLFTEFETQWNLANNNTTRTPEVIGAKDVAKEAMVKGPGGIRELAGIIQEFPGTTRAERIALGLTVRDTTPSPIPQPTSAPDLTVVSVLDRTVKLRLRDILNPDRRARPDGVDGATILMFAGDNPPADPLGWNLLMNTSKTQLDIEFPPSIAAGAKVWLTAFWFNQRKESGPIASPINFRLSDGLAAAA